MTIETIGPMQPMIKIDGAPYVINIKEYESLVNQCQEFMAADTRGLYEMTQIISDTLVDCAHSNTSIDDLKPQLKFLRELGFFLKGMISPLNDPDLR